MYHNGASIYVPARAVSKCMYSQCRINSAYKTMHDWKCSVQIFSYQFPTWCLCSLNFKKSKNMAPHATETTHFFFCCKISLRIWSFDNPQPTTRSVWQSRQCLDIKTLIFLKDLSEDTEMSGVGRIFEGSKAFSNQKYGRAPKPRRHTRFYVAGNSTKRLRSDTRSRRFIQICEGSG